ncbi:GDSL esterase/lipase At4g16230-like [Prosopis cineraria]|uniref:GDSL esterase/lipase At4g16230-like n=1 Tax=Prosopis cineraria TaxID=364024 RepID=UPI00240FF2F5|nr:GDSL esterase/lipase At4g16230-like [Prosopis cineraria]
MDRSVRLKTVIGGFTVLGVLLGMSVSKEAPANFVFGDSLVDAGNNNYLLSLSKANFFPRSIDFGIPTGRFTNGKTIVDIIGQELDMGYTPPYLAATASGPVVLRGVNYASGGAGILNGTGKIFGGRINFDARMDNFAHTRNDIISNIGSLAALNLFKRAIVSALNGTNYDDWKESLNMYLTISEKDLALREPKPMDLSSESSASEIAFHK